MIWSSSSLLVFSFASWNTLDVNDLDLQVLVALKWLLVHHVASRIHEAYLVNSPYSCEQGQVLVLMAVASNLIHGGVAKR